MNIGVIGFGHIGNVVTACLLEDGHRLLCMDSNPATMAAIARGETTISERGVAERLRAGHDAGRLKPALSPQDLSATDLIFCCAGSPPTASGGFDASHIIAAARTCGEAVRLRARHLPPLLLVFRSTMLPGTTETTLAPVLKEVTGELQGLRYELAVNPEFLREGSAIADYRAPSRIVIGERRPGCADRLAELYRGTQATLFRTSFAAAEMVKYADNAFHALKASFANEIGRYCIECGIAPSEVMEIFQAERTLNVSAAYLRPGAPFGGPCLPKDVAALAAGFAARGIEAPVIANILRSNAAHEDYLCALVAKHARPPARLLLAGLAFKPGTADLAESPAVRIALRLLKEGYALSIYDPAMMGAVHTRVPLPEQLQPLLHTTVPAASGIDMVIAMQPSPVIAAFAEAGIPVLDFHRL
ncbi:nucleotide sugar dehydrogenase [Aestuariivirga sp.]|uniref:nucleotide sugar dehydrogenase n=1 Tax=Aestuariivirga sp. TaxID=2650926 RepID=UPI0039E4E31F